MITTGILPWWPTSPPYTFRLHPFMDTGFQGAIGRPRPLSPQGLCLLLSALAVLFAQAPAGLGPTCREVSTQRHYHTAPSEILLLKAAAAQPRNPSSPLIQNPSISTNGHVLLSIAFKPQTQIQCSYPLNL